MVHSNIRSFPETPSSLPRQESISEEKKHDDADDQAAATGDTVGTSTTHRKQSFVPFRNDGSLDYDGKIHFLNGSFFILYIFFV